MMNNYYGGGMMVPGSSVHEEDIEKIINEVKSQGVFDEFRRDCISDVDTKPAYQNLRSRVETTVQKFLEKLKFDSTLNKNVVRENMRKHVIESGFYNPGLDRITDQIVNPKMMPVLYPKVEKIVCEHLNIPYVPSVNPTTSSTKSQPLFNTPGNTNGSLSSHIPSLISGLPGTESLHLGSSADERKDLQANTERNKIEERNQDNEEKQKKDEEDKRELKKEKKENAEDNKPDNGPQDGGSVQDMEVEDNSGEEDTQEKTESELKTGTGAIKNSGGAGRDSGGGVADMEVSPSGAKTPASSPLSGMSDLASHGDSDSNTSRPTSPKQSQADRGSDSDSLYPPGTRGGGPRTPPMEPLTPPCRGPRTPGSIYDETSQQSSRSLLDIGDQRVGRGPRTPGSVNDDTSQNSVMDNEPADYRNEDSRSSLGGRQHDRTTTLSSDKPDLLNIRTENPARRRDRNAKDNDSDSETNISKGKDRQTERERQESDEKEDGEVDDDEEEEDDKMEGIEKCVPLETDWLLVQLPKIPHFAHARAKVMVALRQACQVENDPHLVITYLVFLSKFGIVGADIAELTELVQDVANLIVERSTIMTAILPSYSDVSYLDKNVALDSMLNIFYTYFNMVRQPERESFVWSESQDQILVQWPSGEQCTCNILVVHAMVILLSHGPQSYVQQYHHLLDVWFPLDHTQAPRAFLVDTSEEALLIPDWLKLRMIRSKVPRLVDAALEDLEPTQLLLFIQSFGIPIGSMSKLLETLDLSVSEDKSTVENAVMDKAYMVQLVEVQHQRGATGGKVFANIIGQDIIASPERQDSPSPTPLSLSVTDITGDVEMKSVCDSKEDHSQITPSQIIKLLTSPDMLLALLKRLCEELSATKTKNESTPFIKQVLFELMTHSMSKQQCFHLVDGMLRNMNNATMILRMLTASSVRDVVASLSMSVKNIKDNLIKAHKVLSSPLLLIIDDFFKRNKQVLNRKKKGVKSQMKGELLDWLVQIEPEPISLTYSPSKEAMICRMFSQEGKNCPYILTLLIHHASWTTLHQCVQILLTRLSVESCNPRTVLDFLQALNSNPKFWQGREKNVPKHKENTYDDVLSLTHEQVICVIEYIVKEGELYGVDRIRSRINLCHNITPPVLEYLVRNKHKAYSSLVQKHLYIEFYLRFPSFLSCVGEIAGGTDMIVHMNNTGTTVLDKMSHTIITGLTCVELPRTKNHQLESALRKLASKHPILVLRQLPLIANSLLGIVYLESNVLRNRNYLNLFQQILRLLQLFEPHIFNKVYKESLQYIIDTYTQLFLQHGYMQEVSAMLPKFISFIQNYVSNDAETVNSYIQDNLDKLQAIQSQHPMIGVLINGVHDGEGAGGGGGGYPSETPNIPHDLIIEQLNGPDPSQALQELERFSSCPGVLERLFPSLVSLLSHESSTVRVTALSLLVSYVRHNPACVSSLVPSLLNTLNAATSPDVVASLCERLPDLIVFAQEDALPILSKLFSLNMWMNYNTIPSIMRCISTLSLQSGC
uniref:Integrator complex subunit 1 n=1 Tax=Cacopsylla melanoneura TaxID=428564 RepID=A0A8D8ZNY5_9HEMI